MFGFPFKNTSRKDRASKSPKRPKLSFEHLEDRIVLATTTAVVDGSWLNPAVWDNGVPSIIDDVVIPAGRSVQLDGSAHSAKTLLIGGTLEAIENGVVDKTLVADWILINGGVFRVGTAINRYDTNTLTVTLEGDDPLADFTSVGLTDNNAFLMVRAGGILQLFGESETSWTQLNATASAGSSFITLKEPVAWDIGDEIVIASTTFDMNEAETRTIVNVLGGGTILQLNSQLTYSHYGELQDYDDGNGTIYTLDERAEVGLLTHSIKIQGDADVTTDGIGGHLMFMPGSGIIQIDGVELYHMGQRAQLARYPIHWHQAGDRTGDFVKNSSIHHTFNRAVTIHGTQNTLLEQNVAYDHVGHGFFLEDAVETGNKLYFNLGLVTREPQPGEELLPSDLGPKQFQISGPGTFWITNPDNELIGNVAGGSQQGSGFWYALPTGPLGPSASDPQYAGVNPQTTALGIFQGNRAHSNAIGLDLDGGPDANDVPISSHYNPPAIADFQDFTAFANDKNGVYYRGTSNIHLSNALLADNFQNVMFAFGQTLRGSLMVGESDNAFGGATKHGFAIYDGPTIVQDVHFAGFNVAGAEVFSIIGAASRNTNHRFQGLTFDTPTPFVLEDAFETHNRARRWGFSLYDVDGSLTGTAGLSVIYDHPMMRTSTDTLPAGWENAVLSPSRFGQLKLSHGLTGPKFASVGEPTEPRVTFTRTDGPGDDVVFTSYPRYEPYTQIGAVMNTDFIYDVRYDSPLASDFIRLDATDLIQNSDYIYLRVHRPSTWNAMSGSSAIELSSELAVRNSSLSAFFVDPLSNTAFIKLFGTNDVRLDRIGGAIVPPTPADSVLIADFSFEDGPPGPLGQGSHAPWIVDASGTAGFHAVDASNFGIAPTDGIQKAFVRSTGKSSANSILDGLPLVIRNVSDTLAQPTAYEVRMDAATLNLGPDNGFILELGYQAGGSTNAADFVPISTFADTWNELLGGLAGVGQFHEVVLQAVVPIGHDAIGDPLAIRFTNAAQSIFADNNAFIDNVRLFEVTIVPDADFNEDSFVDGADLNAWQQGYGTAGTATKSQGDANLDGNVDGSDFLTWQRQLQPNLVLNGDFSANATAFTVWPGYNLDGANPTIANWTQIGGGTGINGPDTGFAGEPFAPTNTVGIDNFAFIQSPGGLVQSGLTLLSDREYRISFDAASRANNTALGRVLIADDGGTIFESTETTWSNAVFEPFSATFTTPSVMGSSGTVSVSLFQSTAGDTTAVYANVGLVKTLPTSPLSALVTQSTVSASAQISTRSLQVDQEPQVSTLETQPSTLSIAAISAPLQQVVEESHAPVSEPLNQSEFLRAHDSFLVVSPRSPHVTELKSKALSLLGRRDRFSEALTPRFEDNKLVQQPGLTETIKSSEGPSRHSEGHQRSSAIRAVDDFFAQLDQEKPFENSLPLHLRSFV